MGLRGLFEGELHLYFYLYLPQIPEGLTSNAVQPAEINCHDRPTFHQFIFFGGADGGGS